jgi:hypothetical protein
MSRVGDKPLIAPTARGLGARPETDILVSSSGEVSPGTGGMSVAPDWKLLPAWRIPRRLAHIVPKARGRNEDACWRLGRYPFVPGPITEQLQLVSDGPTHGVVEPAFEMSFNQYQLALASTKDEWIIDES